MIGFLKNMLHNLTHSHHELVKADVGIVHICIPRAPWDHDVNISLYPEYRKYEQPYLLSNVSEEEFDKVLSSRNLIRTYLNIKQAREDEIENERGESV